MAVLKQYCREAMKLDIDSLRERLRIECEDAEVEPVPAPVDTYCTMIKTKARVKVSENLKTGKLALKKKRMTPRMSYRSLNFDNGGGFGDQLRIKDAIKDAIKGANEKRHMKKGATVGDFSDIYSASFSDNSSRRRTGAGFRGGSPRKSPNRPVI